MTHRTLLLIPALLTLSACAMSAEARIKQEIAAANRCETVADCVDVGGKCPFDCYIFVHKDEADRIKTMVEGFPSQCTYSCMAIDGVDCIDHKCVPRIPGPPAESGDDEAMIEGNAGAACASHDECVTPMSYLIQSNCPYASRCIAGSCAVVCPEWEHSSDPDESVSHEVKCDADADCDCDGRENCRCIDGGCMAVVKSV